MSIKISVNVKKIDKQYLVNGKTGAAYLSLALRKNKNGKDQYGNDGFVVQEIPKAMRKEGVRGPIIGNYKEYEDNFIKSYSKPQEDEEIDF